ncbi:hypothetical protein, partial [Chlamydia pneumoniae]
MFSRLFFTSFSAEVVNTFFESGMS